MMTLNGGRLSQSCGKDCGHCVCVCVRALLLLVVHGRSPDEQGPSAEGVGHTVCLRRRAMLGRCCHWADQHAQEPIHRHSPVYAPFLSLILLLLLLMLLLLLILLRLATITIVLQPLCRRTSFSSPFLHPLLTTGAKVCCLHAHVDGN